MNIFILHWLSHYLFVCRIAAAIDNNEQVDWCKHALAILRETQTGAPIGLETIVEVIEESGENGP